MGSRFNYDPAAPVSYTIIVPNLLTVRILIGPFKAYSGLLYELYLGPMMVNIRTLGTCKLNIHELAQKYQIQSNLAKNKIGNGLPGEYLWKASS